MKTRIEFRAWDGGNKKMIYSAEYLESFFQSVPADMGLMQFTGVHDCKDIKIFEGDILEAYGKYWKVIFSEGCFVAFGPGRWKALRTMYCEVKGNIYETPKLFVGR